MELEDTRTEWQKRVGVGERSRAFSLLRGTKKTTPVLVEEGKRAGKVGGYQTEHWSGRVDATVMPPTLTMKLKPQEGD